MWSAVFLLDMKGKVLIYRNYRGDVSRSVADKFSRVLQESESDIKPVFTIDGVTYAFIAYRNVCLLAVTRKNCNVTTALYYMHRLREVLCVYLGELEEESIRDNFVIIYELLDETMDFGYPQITDADILLKYIRTDAHKLTRRGAAGASASSALAPPDAVTNAVSWREPGIMHKRNEVFLDVVEKVHMLVAPSGAVLSSAISGAVEMRTYLTGMPDLKLGLNERAMLAAAGKAVRGKAVDLEDVKFHRCVRLTDYERDKVISFIPPDGPFTLMTYRISTPLKPVIEVKAAITKHGRSRLEYAVSIRTRFKPRSTASVVEVIIPVPSDVDSPAFQAAPMQKVTYVPDISAFKWVVKGMAGGQVHRMRAQFGRPSVEGDGDDEWRKPISVRFEIPYFTVSGLSVRYLRVLEKSGYQAQPWVRYITQAGDYQCRMASS